MTTSRSSPYCSISTSRTAFLNACRMSASAIPCLNAESVNRTLTLDSDASFVNLRLTLRRVRATGNIGT